MFATKLSAVFGKAFFPVKKAFVRMRGLLKAGAQDVRKNYLMT